MTHRTSGVLLDDRRFIEQPRQSNAAVPVLGKPRRRARRDAVQHRNGVGSDSTLQVDFSRHPKAATKKPLENVQNIPPGGT
jgi:hypothetical protein